MLGFAPVPDAEIIPDDGAVYSGRKRALIIRFNLREYWQRFLDAICDALLFEYERRISRRMQELADDILKIESGRLDVVLPETKHHDEIDIFAHNLNEMQRRLADQLESEKRGLEKQRQLELLQKDAEFYALQAQIKPHFLFNTLEVIRMRAVTD